MERMSRTFPLLALAPILLAQIGCAPTPAAHPAPTPAPEHPLVHRFQHADDWTKEFDDPARDAWQKPDAVIAAMKITPGMTVADVGAGTGYFETYLSRAVGPGGRVLALDIEPDMIKHLQRRAAAQHWTNVDPVLVAVDDPRLPAGKVDRILVVDTWHHIPARDAYARKLRDALAPGGAVFVVDFAADSPRGPPKALRVAPEQVMRELGGAGLTAAVEPVGLPTQYVVSGRL